MKRFLDFMDKYGYILEILFYLIFIPIILVLGYAWILAK